MRMIKKYATKLTLLSSVILMISCANKKEKEETKTKDPCLSSHEKKELNLLNVSNSAVTQKLRLNGKVTYNPNALIHYVSLVSGTLTKTYVSVGDQVEQGQVLAEVKSVDLNALETQLNQLKAKLKVANREWETTQEFYEENVASEKELLEAKNERENMEAELEKLKANLALYSAKSKEGVYQIVAPQRGVLVENQMVSGMRFSAEGDPLFTLSNLDEVWVELNVYATEIDFVKRDMPVHIKTSSYPDKRFDAKIDRISSVIDPEENVLKAWAVLDNKEQFLKPGLHVEAIVESEKDQQAPRLPSNAVIFRNNQYYAVVVKDCEPEAREIEVLYQDEKSVYIAKGLRADEKVVTRNTLEQFEHAVSKEK